MASKIIDLIKGTVKPTKEQKSAEVLRSKLDRLWSESQNDRKQWDWKWYMYDLWVKGYHYARYDSRTKQVISKPVKDGRPKVVVNKIYPTLRSVRNYVLRNQPKAQVTPENLTDDTLDQANMATKFLDFIHESEALRPKLKATVWQALEFSVGWWQVLWNGEKIEINGVDTFDLYPDPKARSTKEMRYAVLAVRRRISDLKDDPKYDKAAVENIKADNKLASSSYKEMLLNFDNSQKSAASTEDGTVIVKEFWYKEEDKVYVCTQVGEVVIREPEQVDTPVIPFFKLSSDISPFSMYGEGWVKNMIDPQKLLNSGMSSVAEYNMIMNKVKVVADKGAGVRVIRNEHGEIIEKKRGYTVTTQSPAPMSDAVFRQIDLANMFIEDIGAMHDASRGRVPTGASSGRAIEALQVGDSNNLSEVVENIEDFLEDVYEYVLWLTSQKYQELNKIIISDYTGQRQFLQVVGSSSPVAQAMGENIPDNTLVISDKNLVDVKITSWLAFTPEAKRESVKELFQIMPDLPPDVILDAYGVGNIADVIKGIKEKRKEDEAAKLQQEAASQTQQQNIANPQSSGAEAFAAARTIIGGGSPQVPQNAGQEYIDAMDQIIAKSKQVGDVEPQVMQALQTFRDQVAQGVGR